MSAVEARPDERVDADLLAGHEFDVPCTYSAREHVTGHIDSAVWALWLSPTKECGCPSRDYYTACDACCRYVTRRNVLYRCKHCGAANRSNIYRKERFR